MFGFVKKFKDEVSTLLHAHEQKVSDGFDAVQQRLVTLETKVEALYHHANETAPAAQPGAPDAKQDA